jgi:hypothetical protein
LSFSASQLESECDLLEQQIQLCDQFHIFKENFSICETHNLRLHDDLDRLTIVHSTLATDFSRLQAENAQLCQAIKPTPKQDRALLVYSAAIAHFRKSYQAHPRGYYGDDASAYRRVCYDWQSHFGRVPPPSQLPDDYG